jgi:hypothetical protein
MFPEIKQTRFHNTVEFYSLFLLVWQMDKDNLVLADKKRNKIAFEILRKLSTEIDGLRDKYKKAKDARPRPPYSEYFLTVQSQTDSFPMRDRRGRVLRSLLTPLYARKDEQRTFSPEQRRIIWNTEDKKTCKKCKKPISWDDFQVDHVISHLRGGKTDLSNAQILCRKCNIKKGG